MTNRTSSPTITDNPLPALFESIFRETHPFEIVRSRVDRQILRIDPISPGMGELFVKVYRHRAAADGLKALLAKTGGRHDFRMCSLLLKARLCVPEPVGCASWPPRRLLPQKTAFAQQWTRSGHALMQLMRRKKEAGQLTEQWLSRLFDSLGRFVATIHRRGFFPRDLHPGNLLLKETSQGEISLMLIDYESIRLRYFRRHAIAHLSLGHLCSYLNSFAGDVHEQLSLAYANQWPVDHPMQLAARAKRVAEEHFAARQKRIDHAFHQIALTRKKPHDAS